MSPAPAAAFAPLRHPVFRALWIANLASNTGLWIQNTGAGWLMTSLAPSPVIAVYNGTLGAGFGHQFDRISNAGLVFAKAA
jgi:hypothetical protein